MSTLFDVRSDELFRFVDELLLFAAAVDDELLDEDEIEEGVATTLGVAVEALVVVEMALR